MGRLMAHAQCLWDRMNGELLTLRHRFCPLKDGSYMNLDYYEARKDHPEDAGPAPRIPEAFLWHVFESLCVAGLLLERGVVEDNPMRHWRTIVHRDLRPANIFFGMPDKYQFTRYPTPKIGDFGLAVYAPPSNYRGSVDELYTPGGAQDNVPPEQRPDLMPESRWDEVGFVSSKTNVWVSV
jgi:serine/threonine protein kinase